MRPLSNDLLVEAWERGTHLNPLGRALTILSCASPQRSTAEWEALSLPERDLELWRIRQATFGDWLRGLATCDACGARLEFEVQVAALLDRLAVAKPEATEWRTGELVFSMRPANSGDLAAAIALAEPGAARRLLLERCTSVRRVVRRADGAAEEVPAPLADEHEPAVIARFEAMHQEAELGLTLHCPACRRSQRAVFDIAHFLWTEVSSAARALLREVHELARAYGWAEAAILGMSGARRRAYLEMSQL